MAIHTSILAQKIPQTETPGRLQSMGVTKSRTRLSNLAFMHMYILMRTLSSTLLANFIYTVVFSTMVIIVYISSSNLIQLTTDSLYSQQPLPISPIPTTSRNRSCILCFQESDFFFQIPHISDTMQILSFSDFTQHSALKAHPYYCKQQDFLFSWLNNTPSYLCVCIFTF